MGDPLRVASAECSARVVTLETQVAQFIEAAEASREKRVRSHQINAVVTAVAVLCVVALVVSGRDGPLFGDLTVLRGSLVIGLTWAMFELAAVTFHLLGPRHWLSRFTSNIDQLCESSALMILLVLSGSAAVLFLLVSTARGFGWRLQRASAVRRTLVVGVVSHVSVAVACVLVERTGDAVMVLLSLCAFGVAHVMTANSMARSVRVRLERDVLERELLGLEVNQFRGRMAREIHDGVGADVMALVLQLRQAAKTDAKAGELASEAQQILEDLRTVVWSLRSEPSKLEELGKVLDAKCARVCEGISYQRLANEADALQVIGPAQALAVLRVAPELVRIARGHRGVTWVQLSLRIGAALEVAVEADAEAFDEQSLSEPRGWVAEVSGTLTAMGTRAGATLPLR